MNRDEKLERLREQAEQDVSLSREEWEQAEEEAEEEERQDFAKEESVEKALVDYFRDEGWTFEAIEKAAKATEELRVVCQKVVHWEDRERRYPPKRALKEPQRKSMKEAVAACQLEVAQLIDQSMDCHAEYSDDLTPVKLLMFVKKKVQ